MNPDRWLDQYYAGEYFSGEFDHLKDLIHKLSLDKFDSQIITIAGTNGKGETSRSIASVLDDEKISYALWTSPHLICVNERFHFSGTDSKSEELIIAFEQLQTSLKEHQVKLSYFEFLFVSFLIMVQKKSPQFLILEVGLGGRLDAVNALNADFCVLTSISRDHQEILGSTYREILLEKLGIIRQGCVLMTALELDYLQLLVKEQVEKNNIDWVDLFKENRVNKRDNFSKRNRITATETLSKALGKVILPERVKAELAKRFFFAMGDVSFDLFPSHNVDGLRKLVQFLKDAKYTSYDYLLISFSDREYEDLRLMVKIILSHYKHLKVLLYEFQHPKAVDRKKLEQISEEFGLEVTDDKNLFQKIDTSIKQKVLVTGSNYFLGEFIKSHHCTSIK